MRALLPLLLPVLHVACAAPTAATPKVHAFRLLPGQDLRAGIQRFVDEHGIEAGWVATCVGSLTDWSLRFANEKDGSRGSGHFEIVSLCGTVSKNGSHLHLAVSDGEGRTIGGHVLDGCRVYTTAEVVLGESPAHVFTRAVDGSTPWAELQVGWRR
ncbi:MAG: DNA-binding protein [Planctomycetes bacterium]|nr:DNA-binding protein [Planctomycetota bacterium]